MTNYPSFVVSVLVRASLSAITASTPETKAAIKIPAFADSNRIPGAKDSPEKNKDIVKPIPVSKEIPVRRFRFSI